MRTIQQYVVIKFTNNMRVNHTDSEITLLTIEDQIVVRNGQKIY